MKKLKKLLPAIIAIVLAFTMVFAVACSGGCGNCGGEKEDPEVLSSISLDTANTKTKYEVGEEFSTAGLVVTATFTKGSESNSKTVELTDPNLVIDSSAYNKSAYGSYEIKVSYTFDGVTKETSYIVRVVIFVDGPGLKVSLATGTPDTIELSETQKTATIDLTKIVVEVVSETGETVNTLTDKDYTVELYSGSEKLTETSGLGSGVYQIWATVNGFYKMDKDWTPSSFILVYVVNDLVSLAWDSSAEGTLTEQEASSKDSISSTWKFTATYANGETKDVTEKVVLSGVDTKVAGEAKTATATYTEANAKGEKISKTADVTYTITQASGPAKTESFLVPDTAVPEAEATITAGSNIEDNSLFTVTASGDMIYSIGKDASAGVGNSSKAVTAQLLDGSSKTFLQGLKQKDATTPNASETVETGASVTITAKANVTLRVYVGLANDGFNSDRAGSIKYTVTGGEAQTSAIAKREKIATIEVTLTEGQTLTLVGVLNANTDDSKSGKLWLFGVEAQGESGSAPAGASESFLVPDTAVPEAEATITAGTNIEDNSLFTVTASGDMIYSIGKDTSAGVGNSSKAVTAQLLDGSSKTFLQGLKQKDATTPNASETVETGASVTITAKANVTLRVYVGLANDGFNSDRAGSIKYTVTGGEAQTSAIAKREKIATIEVTLTEGQTLTLVGVLNANTDDSKSGKLWLFGVEAKTN